MNRQHFFVGVSHLVLSPCYFDPQTATEKHKMNVPETMNEFLDMSDDEGKAALSPCHFSFENDLCRRYIVLSFHNKMYLFQCI